jgi:hypothetical protein
MRAFSAPTSNVCPGTSTQTAFWGTSFAVRTQATPGTAFAAETSTRTTRAWARSERLSAAWSIPGTP